MRGLREAIADCGLRIADRQELPIVAFFPEPHLASSGSGAGLDFRARIV
jgi:hypothetical protein